MHANEGCEVLCLILAVLKLNMAEAVVFCSSCGTNLKATDRFCFKCGVRITGNNNDNNTSNSNMSSSSALPDHTSSNREKHNTLVDYMDIKSQERTGFGPHRGGGVLRLSVIRGRADLQGQLFEQKYFRQGMKFRF